MNRSREEILGDSQAARIIAGAPFAEGSNEHGTTSAQRVQKAIGERPGHDSSPLPDPEREAGICNNQIWSDAGQMMVACQYDRETCPKHGPDLECYVNVYLCTLGWGGPEEGGWWYDINQIVRVIPTQRKYAEEIRSRLEVDEFSNEGRQPKHNVNSDGTYSICIEDEPGVTTPQERPRYE